MPGLIAAGAAANWTYGGSILTFAFPMLLFVAVAWALYVLFTKPHLVPGHRYHAETRASDAPPPAAMPGPGQPATGGSQSPAAASAVEDK